MPKYQLPNGWTDEPLSALVERLNSGVSVNSDDKPCAADEFGILKTSCVNGGRFDPSENKVILFSEVGRATLNPKADSILISRMNTFDLVGESAYVGGDFENLFVPDRLWQTVIRADRQTSTRWLSFVVQSPLFRAGVSRSATGTSGSMKNISQGSYLAIRVQVPTPAEQRRIAEILGTVDEAIEQTEALVQKWQQMKAGLMHDLFTRGVTPDGQLRPTRQAAPHLYHQSPLGWIPKEWEVKLLGDLVSPNRPIVYGILMPGTGFDGGIPVVKVKDIKDGEVQTGDLLLTSPAIDAQFPRSKLRGGDILLTIRGTVGRVAEVPAILHDANITQDTARIGVTHGLSSYVRYFLESDAARQHFAVNTLGQAVQGINLRDVRTTIVPLPVESEQQIIADTLKGIVKVLNSNREFLTKLRAQKQGLMQDLLTGRVQVNANSERR